MYVRRACSTLITDCLSRMGLGLGFWHAVHYIEGHVRANPMMVVLFPCSGVRRSVHRPHRDIIFVTQVVFFALLLPLVFFLCFEVWIAECW